MKKGHINGSKKSAINRINIKAMILKILNESDKPLSTSEISILLNKSWHTIIRYCLDLENEDKVIKFELGRINAWQIKK